MIMEAEVGMLIVETIAKIRRAFFVQASRMNHASLWSSTVHGGGKRRGFTSSGIRRPRAPAPGEAITQILQQVFLTLRRFRKLGRDMPPGSLMAVRRRQVLVDQVPHIGQGRKLHDGWDGQGPRQAAGPVRARQGRNPTQKQDRLRPTKMGMRTVRVESQ